MVPMIQKYGLTFLVSASLLTGCGGYNSVKFMIPRTENGWKPQTSVIGIPSFYFYNFSCKGKSIGITTPLVYSRRLAEGPFYIPIPYFKKQKPSPDITEPMRLQVSIQSKKIFSCEASMVSVTSRRLKGGAVPIRIVNEEGSGGLREFHNTPIGLHFCIFETPPVSDIGDELQVQFRSDLLDCEVPPLRFDRKDSIKYIGGIGA